MEEMRLGYMESKFADIVWQNAPMSTRDLVSICEQELNWARTTTYTVLKKLCNRAMLQMEKGYVTTLVSRDEFYAIQCEKFVDKNFDGSLAAFLASYTSRKELTAEDAAAIRELIGSHQGLRID